MQITNKSIPDCNSTFQGRRNNLSKWTWFEENKKVRNCTIETPLHHFQRNKTRSNLDNEVWTWVIS